MTWIDVVMYAGVALLFGIVVGFKTGLSIMSGTPSYEQGVRDGMELEKRLKSGGTLVRLSGPSDAVEQVIAYAREVGKAHRDPVKLERVQ